MNQLTRLVTWFEQLSPESLEQIGDFYHATCYFKDPFNEFEDRNALKQVFVRMFAQLQQPRFVIVDTVRQDQVVFLVWQFHFLLRQRAFVIKGSSHLKFDEQGLVTFHRDYWDAAEELYEKLPLIGFVLRQLKKMSH